MISRIDRRPRKNGKVSWRVRIWRGYDADGNQVKDSATFRSKGEAEEFVRAKNAERDHSPVKVVLTLNQYLDSWLATVKTTRAYYTWKRYTTLIAPVREALGTKRLEKLTALDFEAALHPLYEKGLSDRSVKHAFDAIRAALNKAVEKKLLAYNPVLGCEVREPEDKDALAIDRQAIDRLLAAADGWLAVAIRLAADTGARRGELCGFRWRDLDDSGRLRIWRSVGQENDGTLFIKATKAGRERRILLSPNTLAYLELHQERQLQDAALFGDDYRHDLDLILANPDGNYRKPQSMSMAMRALTKRAGIKAGMHTLRHSHASILLSSGAPLAAVSKRLGHSKVSTTTDTYSHVLPGDEAKIIEIIDRPTEPKKKASKMGKNGEPGRQQLKTAHQKPN